MNTPLDPATVERLRADVHAFCAARGITPPEVTATGVMWRIPVGTINVAAVRAIILSRVDEAGR